MDITESHLDVLQNIEHAIGGVYEEYPRITDYRVMSALDALIASYRAEFRGHRPKECFLDREECLIHDRVRAICEWRMGRGQDAAVLEELSVTPTNLEDMLSCLRKIRKSVDRWNGQLGPQGYLGFMTQFL
jgi:hypothetical protein